MSIFDDLMPKTAQEEMYDKVQGNLYNNLCNLANSCGIDMNEISMQFKDPDFLEAFFQLFDEEEQRKYFITSYNYEHRLETNIDNLLAFRRAIYTDYPKNENFWSTEFLEPRFGLRAEQPEDSPERIYSSIMVTTVGKLKEHGLADLTSGGATDGEIAIDASKPFDDFLFVYKPKDELEVMQQYIASGGKSIDDVIQEKAEQAVMRQEAQGYKL